MSRRLQRVEAIKMAVQAVSGFMRVATRINNAFDKHPEVDDVWLDVSAYEALYMAGYENVRKMEYIVYLAQRIAKGDIQIHFSDKYLDSIKDRS